jgi:hypothetical protein
MYFSDALRNGVFPNAPSIAAREGQFATVEVDASTNATDSLRGFGQERGAVVQLFGLANLVLARKL